MIQIRKDIIITRSFVKCVVLGVNSIRKDISINAQNEILRLVFEKEKESPKGSKLGRIVEYLENVGHTQRLKTCTKAQTKQEYNNVTKTRVLGWPNRRPT